MQQQTPQQPKPQTDADARIAAEVSVSDPGARRTIEGLLRLCGIRGSDAGPRTLLIRITDDLSAQADPPEGLCVTVLLVPRERTAGLEFSGFPRSGPVFVLGTPILLEEGEAVLSSARAILSGLGPDSLNDPNDPNGPDSPDSDSRKHPVSRPSERDPAGLAGRSRAWRLSGRRRPRRRTARGEVRPRRRRTRPAAAKVRRPRPWRRAPRPCRRSRRGAEAPAPRCPTWRSFVPRWMKVWR